MARRRRAEVADHVEPHRGDVNAFYLGELRSLCRRCHERTKKQIERRGYDPGIGADGMPVDPRHPVYQGRRRGGSEATLKKVRIACPKSPKVSVL